MKTAIIGAGAAGCFCAVNLKRLCPDMQIDLYESGQKPLQKVAITGGGRCNITNTFAEVKSLQQVYPRGYNLMKRLLKGFDHENTLRWFENEGVRFVAQEDQCIFPRSQDAMEIVSTLLLGLRECRILCNERVLSIEPAEGRYRIFTDRHSEIYDYAVVTTGGSPKASGLDFLAPLQLEIVAPVPSLFTFNIATTTKAKIPITSLMGVVIEEASVSLAGTKFRTNGPLLITHWGMSGPAILKLSSHAARWLNEHKYQATLCVNWLGTQTEEQVRQTLSAQFSANPQKQLSSLRPVRERLWHYIINKVEIAPERRCAEIGSKQFNRLVSVLTSDTYQISGQSRCKEEFVTCGGVALSCLNPQTLECKQHPGLFLAGEVTDVDAVTGGFNLQAAWSMGYAVAQAIGK